MRTREIFEFYCSIEGQGCGRRFDVMLNIALNGKHRVHCPICGHKHYRIVKDGKITEDRYTERENELFADDLYPMKSSLKNTQNSEEGKDHSVRGFFIRDAWRNTVKSLHRQR